MPDLLFRTYRRNSPFGNLQKVTSLALLCILIGIAFLGMLPQAANYSSAASTIVQNETSSSACTSGSTCTVALALPSSVKSGDVIVVAAFDLGSSSLSVSDSRSLLYSAIASTTDASNDGMYIFAATVSSSGLDTVTLQDSSAKSTAIYGEFLEVSGVTTAENLTGKGSDSCAAFPCGISDLTSSSFASGSFLLSEFAVHYSGAGFTPGAGFTSQTLLSGEGFTEYATSGVSSPTFFPAVLTSSSASFGKWTELSVVLEPQGSSTTTSVSSTSTSSTLSTTTDSSNATSSTTVNPTTTSTTSTSSTTSESTVSSTTSSSNSSTTSTTASNSYYTSATGTSSMTNQTTTPISNTTTTTMSTVTITSDSSSTSDPTTTATTASSSSSGSSSSTSTSSPSTSSSTETTWTTTTDSQTTASTTSTSTTTVTTSTTTTSTGSLLLPTKTSIVCTPSKVRAGRTVQCEIVVKSSTMPSGEISVTVTQGTLSQASNVKCQPIPGEEACYATFSFTPARSGDLVITAAYTGNATHSSSHASALVQVKCGSDDRRRRH